MVQVAKKKPVQDRAKVTVAAIMEAAGQVLAAEGLQRATTHRIAKRAGVSVGTLYQYFPNKESVFIELLRDYRRDSVERLAVTLGGTTALPLAEVIGLAVDCFTEPFYERPEASRALMQNRDAFASHEERKEQMEMIQQFIVTAMEARDDIPSMPDPDQVAFNVVRIADALSAAAVVERPESFHDGSHKRELTHLVVSYLTTPRS